MKEKLWTKNFILLIFAAATVFIAANMINSPLPIYAMHIGGSNSVAGLVTGLFALSSCICRPIFGNLLDKTGRRWILLTGIVVYCLVTFSYNWANTILLLLVLDFFKGSA
jgi:MFS family permease